MNAGSPVINSTFTEGLHIHIKPLDVFVTNNKQVN